MYNIKDLHKKLTRSLWISLIDGKITKEDVLAYMIFFDSLWDNYYEFINIVYKIYKKDWLFEDFINYIESHNSENKDKNKSQKLLNNIINN